MLKKIKNKSIKIFAFLILITIIFLTIYGIITLLGTQKVENLIKGNCRILLLKISFFDNIRLKNNIVKSP